jgi:hypothetical protein
MTKYLNLENHKAKTMDSNEYGLMPDGELYHQVERIEQKRLFKGSLDDLAIIEEEIRIRVKITQQEIFKIGELLMIGKQICLERGIGFEQWIIESFDFSKKTAENFMNIYKNCLGYKPIALKLPVSILYQIARPSVSNELREFLFEQGNIVQIIKNNRISQLVTKWNQGGKDAIEADIIELNRDVYVYNQINFTFNLGENALRILEGLWEKIDKQGKIVFNRFISDNEQVDREPEVVQAIQCLQDAVGESIQLIEKAREEAQKMHEEYLEKISVEA